MSQLLQKYINHTSNISLILLERIDAYDM